VKEKGKEKILTPHISPIKGVGATTISLAGETLPGPYTSKIADPKSLHGVGEKCFKNFPIF